MAENQTQFSVEEPLYEEVYLPTTEEPKAKKSFIKTKKGKFIIGISAFLVLLLVIVVLAMPKRRTETTVLPTPTPEILETSKSGFDKRIEELENELNRADPTDTVLPFPAIDMNLELERVE